MNKVEAYFIKVISVIILLSIYKISVEVSSRSNAFLSSTYLI